MHKESIDWAIAELAGDVCACGRTGVDLSAAARTVRKLVASGKTLAFCRRAGVSWIANEWRLLPVSCP